ncbi:hypothetical protein [Azospirillum sp. TSO22-1]|uniref:hypothetical protein n=1 Tax=Azospirillum sp. TSO22-1 TaxID=716789 RepID=UPI000D62220F|nr:hypothetical protein [Azospirillum sp. TSO22-1]PWC53424.1 hypothetical protein TSO221_10895 [Azospirillum sp. TSO22-1]
MHSIIQPMEPAMHAAPFDIPSFQPMLPAQPAENDADARLVKEVLATLWSLLTRPDAETELRPDAARHG